MKLTKLLSDSLGGNSRLCTLIICASPSVYNVVETVTTCRFGQRAKLIQNKAKINQEMSLADYKNMLEEANKKIEQQQEIIAHLETELGIPENMRTPREVLLTPSRPASAVPKPLNAVHLNDDDDLDGDGARPVKLSPTTPHGTSLGVGGAIAELQNKVSQLQKELEKSAEIEEELRDTLSDKVSELEIQTMSLERVEQMMVVAENTIKELDASRHQLADKLADANGRADKLVMEVEQHKMRAIQAETENERIEGDQIFSS